jgi:hypothetical protein
MVYAIIYCYVKFQINYTYISMTHLSLFYRHESYLA